ncbi:HVO_A0556 family zinc finger protein [Natrarchaeobius chitinivorans]|uniref:Small CPxCG-related zinc finger protein n=1 Tax=Natrarchaeobius chitinivorans TaxID=1679083 RepID=A0A3N6MGR7_NATCH|nr:HVO_A0556 family zinc finger protein [Natrarchaeobius chitinivorans]RQG96030.1 hypothetical protein EA473_07600 [Natrarchaeobius chitinivorans]
MEQLVESEPSAGTVVDALVGGNCSYCEDGTLVRDSYKGNAAAVCDCCETPAVQVWDDDRA